MFGDNPFDEPVLGFNEAPADQQTPLEAGAATGVAQEGVATTAVADTPLEGKRLSARRIKPGCKYYDVKTWPKEAGPKPDLPVLQAEIVLRDPAAKPKWWGVAKCTQWLHETEVLSVDCQTKVVVGRQVCDLAARAACVCPELAGLTNWPLHTRTPAPGSRPGGLPHMRDAGFDSPGCRDSNPPLACPLQPSPPSCLCAERSLRPSCARQACRRTPQCSAGSTPRVWRAELEWESAPGPLPWPAVPVSALFCSSIFLARFGTPEKRDCVQFAASWSQPSPPACIPIPP